MTQLRSRPMPRATSNKGLGPGHDMTLAIGHRTLRLLADVPQRLAGQPMELRPFNWKQAGAQLHPV